MIILIPFFSVWFAELSNIPQNFSEWLAKHYLVYREIKGFRTKFIFNEYTEEDIIPVRLLPFDCSKCLGFWLMVLYSYSDGWIECLVMSGVSSLVAIITSKLIKRL